MDKKTIVEIHHEADFERWVVTESAQRPVLVDFWAAWCGPCQMLMPILSKVAEDLGGTVLLAKVNSDENQDLATQYGVRSLPTVMLFKNGQPVDQFMGAVPESQVRAFIDRHLPKEADFAHQQALELLQGGQRDQALAALEANLERDPRHEPTLISLAGLYLEDGRLEEAARLLEGPLATSDNPEVEKLRARLELTRFTALAEDGNQGGDDPDTLLAEGARLALAGELRPAMERFLTVLARHRSHRDGAARRALLAAFALADDPELVNEFRTKMARLLY